MQCGHPPAPAPAPLLLLLLLPCFFLFFLLFFFITQGASEALTDALMQHYLCEDQNSADDHVGIFPEIGRPNISRLKVQDALTSCAVDSLKSDLDWQYFGQRALGRCMKWFVEFVGDLREQCNVSSPILVPGLQSYIRMIGKCTL